MSRYDFWLFSRYDTVRAAAGDWQTYTSAQGVALTPEFNANIAGSVLATDPPEHDALRAVLSDKLVPRALGETRASIRGYADRLVSEVVERGRFDGVVDVARTQLSLWWFRQVADLAPNHVISKECRRSWSAGRSGARR